MPAVHRGLEKKLYFIQLYVCEKVCNDHFDLDFEHSTSTQGGICGKEQWG